MGAKRQKREGCLMRCTAYSRERDVKMNFDSQAVTKMEQAEKNNTDSLWVSASTHTHARTHARARTHTHTHTHTHTLTVAPPPLLIGRSFIWLELMNRLTYRLVGRAN